MRRFLSQLAILLAVLVVTATTSETADASDPENTLFMDLEFGRVVIEMRPDLAPKTVARVKQLVREKFYDGLTFHRVIGGFMAQGGDPKGNGTGGSGTNLPAEFSQEEHVRGTVSMARSGHPDSADSQFFIVFARSQWLDGKYTIWGQVTEGMGFVGQLKRGSQNNNGSVDDPDKIVRMQVAADVKS